MSGRKDVVEFPRLPLEPEVDQMQTPRVTFGEIHEYMQELHKYMVAWNKIMVDCVQTLNRKEDEE